MPARAEAGGGTSEGTAPPERSARGRRHPSPLRKSPLRLASAALIAVLASHAIAVRPAIGASTTRVTVDLPVPAKLNTVGVKTVLVARFIVSEQAGVDVGKEFVRFVRRELAKGTKFKILDVDPPALPEQPPEELLKNYVFWKHLGEEYGADLIVSGRIVFASADRSAFVQEDYVSPITGQKVRRTRFAEREEFSLETNLWFFKGANGAFLYEDTFRNRQVYEGKSNDALGIFFALADLMSPDLLGVVSTTKRHEPRYLFDE